MSIAPLTLVRINTPVSLLLGVIFGLSLLMPSIAAYAAVAHTDSAPIKQSVTSTHDDEAIATTQSSQVRASVYLSSTAQTQAGIVTRQFEPAQLPTEFPAQANVIDLQGLLEIRGQYLTALAEQQSASAALNFAQQTLNRTEALYQNGVNSQRQFQNLQMQLRVEQARLNSSQYRLQSLNDNLVANWGNPLAEWIKAQDNVQFRNLVNGREALLLLTLPANQHLPEPATHIEVEPNGERQKAQVAQFISKAPKGSDISQGETYFFRTPKAGLRTGMHLSAWITAPGGARKGYVVPVSALIWHAGQAALYLKTAPEQFMRQTITQLSPIKEGYFIADALPDRVEVVITGAQLLLSQEFRAIIPTEDDGDDN